MTKVHLQKLIDARRTIIGVSRTQRGDISDLATIALQEVVIGLGDLIIDLREEIMRDEA